MMRDSIWCHDGTRWLRNMCVSLTTLFRGKSHHGSTVIISVKLVGKVYIVFEKV